MSDIFRQRARTFWFAARFLPSHRRQAVAGLYAFARAIDDLVDNTSPTHSPGDVRAALAAWRRWLDRPDALAPPNTDVAAGLRTALMRHGVPSAYLHLLIDGVTSDLDRREMRSWPDLRTYCVQVASSVGLAMCHLLGSGADPLAREAAVELGIAMQLTNILRDIGDDLQAGRVYLPSEDLAAHGYSRERLAWLAARVQQHGSREIDEPFRELMRGQIARARAHYARGLDGVGRLPADCRLAILLAARLYRAILGVIESADYDVFTRRAATSSWHKLAEAIRWSVVVRLPARSGLSSPPEAVPSQSTGALFADPALRALSTGVLDWVDDAAMVQR